MMSYTSNAIITIVDLGLIEFIHLGNIFIFILT